MPSKGKAKGRYRFREEFRRFSQEGTFSESFFEKLDRLAKNSVSKRHWNPRRLGFPSDSWDEETTHELAMEFLTEHLDAEGKRRLGYLLDRSRSNEVDYLMLTIFDQFLAERAKAISPHRSNLRSRIKRAMAKLVEAGEAKAMAGQFVSWAPPGASLDDPLELNDLIAQAGELPEFHKRVYRGEKRVGPEVSETELNRLLSSIFRSIEGPVDLDTLTDFLCRLLDVRDPVFDSVEAMEEKAEERKASLPAKLASALSETGEAEAIAHLKQALSLLCERQRRIFQMLHLEGRTVPEICASMRVKKSVVYEEIKKIETILRR